MKPESQRIAIAEACGWIDIKPSGRLDGQILAYPPKNFIVGNREELPNYLNDLNAMHEAEKVLTSEQRFSYVEELEKILGLTDEVICSVISWITAHATAAQRAEAFLRTLGLWKD
jgi:hypothetical protein